MTGDCWLKILFLEGNIVIKCNFLKELLLQLFLNLWVFVKQILIFKDYKDDKDYVCIFLHSPYELTDASKYNFYNL